MRVIVCENYDNMSQKAAQFVASQVLLKPNSVLGLATGSTPIGMYKKLINMYEEKVVSFSQVKTFNLDEYRYIEQSNPQSYYYFMQENFFTKVNITSEQTYIPKGMAQDIEKECMEYDKHIEKLGGIDLQILGIGSNGHIGFNEPKDYFETGTHVIKLDESTLKANARFFNNIESVPKEAITMGIGSIFKSKKILLLASGTNKAQAIYDTLYGKVQPQVQSSILKLHQDVILILDKEAASLLQQKDIEKL